MWTKIHYSLEKLSLLNKILISTVIGAAIVGAVTAASDSTSPPTPEINSAETKITEPVVKKKIITEDISIPFEKTTIEDPSLNKGESEIRTVGANGTKRRRYEVTLKDGLEISRVFLDEAILTSPISEVTAVGTKVARRSNCDPNYSGACVPVASDVDCASGSGNGPEYVDGPVYVVGSDIYDLDRDGDGVGCDN